MYIGSIHTNTPGLEQRLRALGIRVGADIHIVRTDLFNHSIQLRVGTTDIVTRREYITHIGPAVHIRIQ